MSKCLFVLPYFGHFKNYFQLFLNSFGNNYNFTLLLITDQNLSKYILPKNIIIQRITFSEFSTIFQNKFEFNISLNTPYKLCDFKPSFGYVLSIDSQYSMYDYWGYIDCDMIIGDLSKLNQIMDMNYFDKIFANGHMTLYKNSHENNTKFMKKIDGRYIYREAFTTKEIYGFDEGGLNCKNELLSVHEIFIKYHSKIFYDDMCFNAYTESYLLHNARYYEDEKRWIYSKKSCILLYANGKILNREKEYSFIVLSNNNHIVKDLKFKIKTAGMSDNDLL